MSYTFDWVPDGFWKCYLCGAIVQTGITHKCHTDLPQTLPPQIHVTYSYPTDRQLLEQILSDLKEIKKLLENK
jgi:hypothetical protein